jgi:hypothetical protein
MPSSIRAIRLRRPDVCASCGCDLAAGERAIWDARAYVAQCMPCGDTWSGQPGGSAQREHERRRDRREGRTRERWGVLGGVAVALSEPPQHEQAWAKGADGERKVARVLDKRAAGHGVVLLHDRCVPGSRANIDHIAIGPAGVFVIDAKRYTGRIGVERRGGLLRPRTEHLLVGGRDRTKLVDGVLAQAEVVRSLCAAAVHPVLCFVDGDWPFMARLEVRGVPILGPRKVAKLCRAQGPLDVEAVAGELAARLPAA